VNSSWSQGAANIDGAMFSLANRIDQMAPAGSVDA
jgi:hypothetical protein